MLLIFNMLVLQDGFSRGLSIDTDDFSLESLDPLRNWIKLKIFFEKKRQLFVFVCFVYEHEIPGNE